MLSFPRITLRQLGHYDASFEAHVEPDGHWHIDSGTYVTHGQRNGQLAPSNHRELARLASRIHMTDRYPLPDADGFISELVIGESTLRWWGPPPTEALRAFTNALARLSR
ncbi:MAG: hypothetical protein AAF170_14910 [Bacteroidota bacterium]